MLGESFLATDDLAEVTTDAELNKRWRPRQRIRGGAGNDSATAALLQCICQCSVCCAATFGTLYMALSHNQGCSYDALKGVKPPYGGELLPRNVTLIERQQWFQITKNVDAYDAITQEHIGYFYDMNFMFFMKFGFSDAKDRIWFEAQYPYWSARFKWSIHYQLKRCDVGTQQEAGRVGGIYDVVEDWYARPWFCFNSCVKKFHISRKDADEDRAAANSKQQVATAIFNSTLDWHGWQARHAWFMNLTEDGSETQLAWAQQHFFRGGRLGINLLSNWTVDVTNEEPFLPNWIMMFMAALDDIEEGHK